MYIALTAEQSRRVDRYMMDERKIPGIVLMENAARSVADKIMETGLSRVCVVCGTGNNGGDGFAVARILASNGYSPDVIIVGNTDKISGDALQNFPYIRDVYGYTGVVSENDLLPAEDILLGSELVVDALFGTGLDRNVSGLYAEMIDLINRSGAFVVSIDIASGIHSDTGQVLGAAVKADCTVSCQTAKIGHFIYPGAYYSGELMVAVIGDDSDCPVYDEEVVCAYGLYDQDFSVAGRKINANKGDFGRLLVIAGSEGMAGAAHLCSSAAVRSGAGLTTLMSVSYVCSCLQTNLPEVMVKAFPGYDGMLSEDSVPMLDSLLADKTAVTIGPGLGVSDGTSSVVRHMLEHYNIRKVFDADAINLIAEDVSILNNSVGEIILTPHPKEFSRLSGQTVDEILSDPVTSARQFAETYGVTVLLKGACTVIASPDGEMALISADVPAMAKGGSGDVLTGIAGALLAQNSDVFVSALTACGIHVSAGYYAQCEYGEYSVTARDIINFIGSAFNDFISDGNDYYSDSEGSDDAVFIVESDEPEKESAAESKRRLLKYKEF